MARMNFDSSNQRGDASKFPKIKLEQGQSLRVLMVDKVPWQEWVHTLRAPKVVNGKAVTEVKNRRNGEQFTDYAMDFVGRPICLGDPGVLEDRGVDPKNCPACALASTDMTKPPERRFAMHVIEYAVKQGSTEVAIPFQVSLKVWAFTERMFDRLVSLATEWGDLQKHDLILGPCTNKMYQNFEVSPSPKAEWLASEERKKLVVETYKESKISDKELAEFCGRTVAPRWMEDDLDKIKGRWELINAANESGSGIDSKMESKGLDESLDDLLTSQTGADTPVESSFKDEVTDTPPFDLDGEVDSKKVESEPAVSKAEKKSEPKEELTFDDLLGLG